MGGTFGVVLSLFAAVAVVFRGQQGPSTHRDIRGRGHEA